MSNYFHPIREELKPAQIKKFTDQELDVISENFELYSNGFRFGSCTDAELMRECRMVLECAREDGKIK